MVEISLRLYRASTVMDTRLLRRALHLRGYKTSSSLPWPWFRTDAPTEIVKATAARYGMAEIEVA